MRFAYYYGKRKKIVDSTVTDVRSEKSFGIVEQPHCPAVLMEQCFLSNSGDYEAWASPEGCKRAGRVYYEGPVRLLRHRAAAQGAGGRAAVTQSSAKRAGEGPALLRACPCR